MSYLDFCWSLVVSMGKKGDLAAPVLLTVPTDDDGGIKAE